MMTTFGDDADVLVALAITDLIKADKALPLQAPLVELAPDDSLGDVTDGRPEDMHKASAR